MIIAPFMMAFAELIKKSPRLRSNKQIKCSNGRGFSSLAVDASNSSEQIVFTHEQDYILFRSVMRKYSGFL